MNRDDLLEIIYGLLFMAALLFVFYAACCADYLIN